MKHYKHCSITVSISIFISIAHYGIIFSLWKCKAFEISRPFASFFFVFPSNACGCSEMKLIFKPGNIWTMPTILCLSFGLVYEFLPQTCRMTHFCYCSNHHHRCIWSFRTKKKNNSKYFHKAYIDMVGVEQAFQWKI